MSIPSAQSWLIDKIEFFIKKYYLNKIIQGSLIVLGCILSYGLLLLIGEYFFYFKPLVKQISLIALIGIGVVVIGVYIIKPALQLSRLSTRLSHKEAARIIGLHFPEVKDKLLNILELSLDDIPYASRELAEASIIQKSSTFRDIPFSNAIRLKKNIKKTPWILVPLLIAAAIYFINPGLFRESSQRLLLVNQEFRKPAPFDIILLNDKLEALHFQDFPLSIEVKGKELPEDVFILLSGGEKIRMNTLKDNRYSFTIKKVDRDTEFRIEAAGYSTQPYTITVIKKPVISECRITLAYPSYLGQAAETIYGFTDLSIPEGTEVTFEIKTQFSDNNYLKINENKLTAEGASALRHQFKNTGTYQYFFESQFYDIQDSTQEFRVNVIKDAFPVISVQELKDSINNEQVLLSGTASDDYGISKAAFVYKILDEKGRQVRTGSKSLELSGGNNISIAHYEDLKLYGLLPGQKAEYYIQVWDNDGVNGPKASRSSVYTYHTIPAEKSKEELLHQNEEMSKSLAEGKEKLNELNKQLDKLKENNVQNQELNPWERTQNLQLLEEHQKFIDQKLEEVEKRLEKQKDIQEQKEYNSQIQEKQKNIEKQIDQLKNQELSEQMKKLQELLEKKNAQMKMSDIEQMQMQNKMFEMSLERLEEMIKDLETQMMMEDLAKELDELIKKQEELYSKTDMGSENQQALAEEQQEIREKLEKLMNEDFQELKNMADDKDLSGEEKMGSDAAGEMQKSQENLNKNNKNDSKQNQNNAAGKMKELSDKLSQMAAGMDMEQLELDIKAVRQLLTNLLRLSFDQEDLISDLTDLKTSSTTYKDYMKKQNQLVANSVVIKDSLFELSKRVVMLGPTINKETLELEKRLRDAVTQLENQNIHHASVNQQYAMTSANNLALILNDLLSNLMQQMSAAMSSGSGSEGQPSSPGQSSPGSKPGDSPGDMMQDIITGQQQIGKGLRELQSEQGQDGQSGQNGEQGGESGGGGTGSGSGSENNNSNVSEQLSRLAYEQSMLRQQLQQLNSMLNSKNIRGNAELIRELQKNMDQIETALINRKIDQTLLRQQENILTRLLEAEDAIRKQEQDHKRQARAGEDKPRPVPPALQKYIDEQKKIREFYKTTPPELKPFYKRMSDEYLKQAAG